MKIEYGIGRYTGCIRQAFEALGLMSKMSKELSTGPAPAKRSGGERSQRRNTRTREWQPGAGDLRSDRRSGGSTLRHSHVSRMPRTFDRGPHINISVPYTERKTP